MRASSYYQIWIAALEKLLAERQLALPDELAAGRALHPPRAGGARAAGGRRGRGAGQGLAHRAPGAAPARFQVGDRVRTRSAHVDHHTRLPATPTANKA